MSAASSTSEQRRVARREGWLWVGMFGGGVAWLAHLILAYLIAEFGCVGGAARMQWLGISAVAWAVMAVTVLTLAAALGAAAAAYRNRPPDRRDGEPSPERTSQMYAYHMGMFADIAFAAVIVFESVPIFYYLQHC